jgi:hypothetical protein
MSVAHEAKFTRHSCWQHVLYLHWTHKWVKQRVVFTITSLFTSGGGVAAYTTRGANRREQNKIEQSGAFELFSNVHDVDGSWKHRHHEEKFCGFDDVVRPTQLSRDDAR